MSLAVPPGSGDPLVGLGRCRPTRSRTSAEDDAGGRRRAGFWRRFPHDKWPWAGWSSSWASSSWPSPPRCSPPTGPTPRISCSSTPARRRRTGSGTDDLGRDILSRLIFGARLSAAGRLPDRGRRPGPRRAPGLVAGFAGARWTSVIMRAMDALFSFPPLVLALTVAALLGPNLNDASIAIAIVFVPSFVRLIRGEVIAVREENYVEAARATGCRLQPADPTPHPAQCGLAAHHPGRPGPRLRHPHRRRPELPGAGRAAADGQLGPDAHRGLPVHLHTPGTLVFPGLAILLTVLAFNLVADGLRDALGRERPKSSSLVAPRRGTPVAAWTGSAAWPAEPAAAPRPSRTRGGPGRRRRELLLAVEHLRVEFATSDGWLPVVEDVGFERRAGAGRSGWSARAARARRCRRWPSWACSRRASAGARRVGALRRPRPHAPERRPSSGRSGATTSP